MFKWNYLNFVRVIYSCLIDVLVIGGNKMEKEVGLVLWLLVVGS